MGKVIEIPEECLNAFAPLSNQTKSNFTDSSPSTKYIIYRMTDDFLSSALVHVSNTTSTLATADASYNDMLSRLPLDHCRWIVYSLDPSEHSTLQQKNIPSTLCFMAWSPETAPIKQRMVYSASKGFFTRGLPGGADMFLFQATSRDEIELPVIVERIVEKYTRD
ncbi:cofilin [Mortierella sp. AM989]|nr:cofilin [Mortierella sp. AM989]